MRRPSILKYIAIALVIFASAVIISICARLILVNDNGGYALHYSEEQAGLITSMIEGAVGAIAAGFVLYQLKQEELLEMKDNELHEAEFYQHFINYWLETDKLFLEYPECRKYFYENADVSDLDPESVEFSRVMGFAEYFDDLFRYSNTEISKQNEHYSPIPNDQIASYRIYIDGITNMPAFQFYKDRYRWINCTQETEAIL